MRRLFGLIAFVVIVLIVVGNIFAWLGNQLGSVEGKVGIIHLYGQISTSEDGSGLFGGTWSSADRMTGLIEDALDDEGIRGVVIRMDSPGGTIAGSQEIYDAVLHLSEKKPVVVSMGDVSASGAYYIAVAAHEIVANPGTTTGSIGVLAMFVNATGLYEKIGLNHSTIKSGKFKDLGNNGRPMTDEERDLILDIVMDDYEQFLEVVVKGRKKAVKNVLAKLLKAGHSSPSLVESVLEKHSGGNTVEEVQVSDDLVNDPSSGETHELSPSENVVDISDEAIEGWIRSIADGRVFNGRQALAYGFIDTLGNFNDSIRICGRRAGITGKPETILLKSRPSFLEMLFEVKSRLSPIKVTVPRSVQFTFLMP